MVDLHIHLLPAVDDGPADLAAAVALAAAAVAAGTEVAVATPHVNRPFPTSSALVRERLAELRTGLERAGVPLRVLPGGELDADVAAATDDDELRALRLGGGPFLLLECPLEPVAPRFAHIARDLLARGHRLVLAHPERSPVLQSRPGTVAELVAAGALCSVTASALEGAHGRAAYWYALELLRDGLVHSVDSDAHHARLRPPGIAAGIAAAARRLPGVEARADWLMSEAPAAILAGDPLPPVPDVR